MPISDATKLQAIDEWIKPLIKRFVGHKVQRLLGYWVLVQTYGSHEALIGTGLLPVSSLERQKREFREMFGAPAEEFIPQAGEHLRDDLYAGLRKRKAS